MKTRFFLLCALMGVLVACNKNENEPQQVAFQKGQKVTLRINASLNNSQNAPRRVSGDINVDGELEFAWEAGDEIQVIVGGQSATFTMTSFAGATAEFTGDMPATGTQFDVTYTPEDAPDAEAIKHQIVENIEDAQTIDKKYFSLKAEGCELGGTIELEWIYSAIKVTMDGSGVMGGAYVGVIRIMPNDSEEEARILEFENHDSNVIETEYAYVIIDNFEALSSTTCSVGIHTYEAKQEGYEIPSYCYNPDWEPTNFTQSFAAGHIYVLPELTLIPYDWD